MNRRKIRLVLLGLAGVIILIIGVGAARIYTDSSIGDPRNEVSQHFYGKNYDQLSVGEKTAIDRLGLLSGIEVRNNRFREWLGAWFVRWVVIPFCAFLVLTAAIVASRLILNKPKPPPNSS